MEADYPLRFIESVVNEFQKGKECEDDGFIVPSSIYEIKKSFISIERPYPIKLNKTFFENIHNLTNNDFRTVIKCYP